jgi:hypothetical protein
MNRYKTFDSILDEELYTDLELPTDSELEDDEVVRDLSDDWYDADDGQPSEYTEWQDYMGGDDWDHGQYDSSDY